MTIRKARKTDFEKYASLRAEGLEDYSAISDEKLKITPKQIKQEFDGIFSSNKRTLLFVEENKEIVGYLIGSLLKNPFMIGGYIDDIFVRQSFRKKGFGNKLISAFSVWAETKGATKIRLGVRTNNKKAIKFYKCVGFEVAHYEMEKLIK